jgi:hypothetical protein
VHLYELPSQVNLDRNRGHRVLKEVLIKALSFYSVWTTVWTAYDDFLLAEQRNLEYLGAAMPKKQKSILYFIVTFSQKTLLSIMSQLKWTTQEHAKPPDPPIDGGFSYQASDGYGDYQRAYLGMATESL